MLMFGDILLNNLFLFKRRTTFPALRRFSHFKEDNFLCLFPAAVFLSDFSSIVPFFRCPVFVFRFVRADVYHLEITVYKIKANAAYRAALYRIGTEPLCTEWVQSCSHRLNVRSSSSLKHVKRRKECRAAQFTFFNNVPIYRRLYMGYRPPQLSDVLYFLYQTY